MDSNPVSCAARGHEQPSTMHLLASLVYADMAKHGISLGDEHVGGQIQLC
jgi:hypothetical protein